MDRNRTGFTLIELLMVVMVIGVLVSIGIPAAFNARKEASVANARQGISDIETAVDHFFQEYGRLPNQNDSEGIIKVLAGDDANDNPREIAFLNVMRVDDTDWDGEYNDPWDRQYDIYIDDDYDSVVTFEGSSVSNVMVVVVSAGPDRMLHSNDDLMSCAPPNDWKK